jgi:hypothetical protein
MAEGRVIAGAEGSISVAGLNINIQSITLQGGRPLLDVSSYGGPDSTEYINLLLGSGITVEGFITDLTDAATFIHDHSVYPLVWTLKTGNVYTDNVVLGPLQVTGRRGEVNRVRMDMGHASGQSVGPSYTFTSES